MKIALITEVFFEAGGPARLTSRLQEAQSQGAALALLPELPLDRWAPATPKPSDQDAEPPGGPRHQAQAEAARTAGIGLVGGAIVVDPDSDRRHNTALVFDATGALVATARKAHLPAEEGFWETDHYRPGDAPPRTCAAFSMRIGVQICSDLNRPQGCHLLGAQGADLIAGPRATPPESYPRWRNVIVANAVTSGAYVASVNRTGPEAGVPIGGPSVVAAPDGTVVLETEAPLAVTVLDGDLLARARRDYPGYLPVRPDLYRRGWAEVAGQQRGKSTRGS